MFIYFNVNDSFFHLPCYMFVYLLIHFFIFSVFGFFYEFICWYVSICLLVASYIRSDLPKRWTWLYCNCKPRLVSWKSNRWIRLLMYFFFFHIVVYFVKDVEYWAWLFGNCVSRSVSYVCSLSKPVSSFYFLCSFLLLIYWLRLEDVQALQKILLIK